MDKKALYRKYRPQDFNSVVGQKHIIKTLINEISSNTTVHAYIFSGPKGSGKTTIAKVFSKAINCLNPLNGNPCNRCKNCIAINTNSSMDFIELDGASNSGVAEIKNLLESIEYCPSILKTKIYIIDEAHMLTNSSWNALLKSIEEPPSNVVFIFATTEYNKIPSTIVSRSERFDFSRISNHELRALLSEVCNKENIKITNNALEEIINLADGAARDALSILEQMRSFSNNDINENDINEVFGLVSIDDCILFINNIFSNNLQDVILSINSFEHRGVDFYHLLFQMIEIIMDKYVYDSTKQLTLLKKFLSADQLLKIKQHNNILDFINIFNDEISRLKNSEKPRFIFEFIILKAMNNLNKNINNNIELFSKNDEGLELDIQTFNEISDKIEKKDDDMTFDTKNLNIWKNSRSTEPFDGPSIKLDSIGEINSTSELPLPNTKELFKTKEIKLTNDCTRKMTSNLDLNESWEVENDNKIIIAEPTHDVNISINIKDDFFAVACNHKSNIKEELNNTLTNVLENSEIEMSPIINKFLKTKKFLIASDNGAFVLMDNKFLCDEFNLVSNSREFLDYYQKTFNRLQKVIAIDKETARTYLDEYKNLKQQSFKDVTINISDENDQDKITKSLLEILNS